jgi:hypothetical protein
MSHDPVYTEGGITAFRCFRPDPAKDVYLKSLVSAYWWKPGPLEADAIPQHGNVSGFWGFKTLPEAIYQEGRTDDLVFALTEHWGKMAYPLMQWLGPDGELVWARETIGPSVADVDAYEMLPAAASYPDETHPADHRLRKVNFEDAAGARYIFWELLGTSKGALDTYALVRPAAESMYRHRVE